ncbi:hypothetical protein DRN94_001735 [archaeon]|nr:hypothetical protein [archaeon]
MLDRPWYRIEVKPPRVVCQFLDYESGKLAKKPDRVVAGKGALAARLTYWLMLLIEKEGVITFVKKGEPPRGCTLEVEAVEPPRAAFLIKDESIDLVEPGGLPPHVLESLKRRAMRSYAALRRFFEERSLCLEAVFLEFARFYTDYALVGALSGDTLLVLRDGEVLDTYALHRELQPWLMQECGGTEE